MGQSTGVELKSQTRAEGLNVQSTPSLVGPRGRVVHCNGALRARRSTGTGGLKRLITFAELGFDSRTAINREPVGAAMEGDPSH